MPPPLAVPQLISLLKRRPVVASGVALLLALAVVGAAAVPGGTSARWVQPSSPSSSPSPQPSPEPSEAVRKTISLSGTGDIVMGNVGGYLPADGGAGFFADVKHLFTADLVMGNMEETITDDTGYRKCRPVEPGEKRTCFQFRVPPAYAHRLGEAGFDLMNLANNHGGDYGGAGYRNTEQSLAAAGLQYTGAAGQITVAEVNGVRVAVLGFSPYPRNNLLTDLDAAREVVGEAATMADIVVIQVHMGAEGSDQVHVRPGTETYLGENRGDPMKFARTVIDAGADLIIGHGPHVVRGVEFYRGRLIAYSLGNFAGGGSLSADGRVGWGAVLHVTLREDGTFVTGQLHSTYYTRTPGTPRPDPQQRTLELMREVTEEDFPETGAIFAANGRISAPAATH